MPFCAECGTEHAAGDNFCGECGAPIGPAHPPLPEPGTPPPPPPGIRSRSSRITAAPRSRPPAGTHASVPPAGSLHLLLPLFAGLAVFLITLFTMGHLLGVPLLLHHIEGDSESAAQPAVSTNITTLPTTPVPAVQVTTAVPAAPTPLVTQELRYEEEYEQVYATNKTFMYGEKISFSYQLTRPPLYVKFNITPAMINRTKIADADLSEVYAVYPSPNAWFEARVLDAATGKEIDKHGYGTGKGYSIDTRQEFMVRTRGDYVLEMAGSDVAANITVLIGTS